MNDQRRQAAIEAGGGVLDPKAWDETWADSGLRALLRGKARATAAAVIDAAAPHLAGEPVGYALANLSRRTIWIEQGVSSVVDNPEHLREPRGGFIRVALIPVDEDLP